MALSDPANLISNSSNTSVASLATASFSPSANAVLLVSVHYARLAPIGTISIADTFSDTLTWTQLVTQTELVGATGEMRCSIFAGVGLSDSPGSGQVQASFTSNAQRTIIIVDEVVGGDIGNGATSLVPETNSVSQTSGTTIAVTLSDIANGNKTYGFVSNNNSGSGITRTSGENLLLEVSTGGTPSFLGQTVHGNDTSLDFGNLNSAQAVALAIELEANRRIFTAK